MWQEMQHICARPVLVDLAKVVGYIRGAGAAVARDDCSTALHQEVSVGPSFLLRDAAVAVRMQVDKSRRDDQVLAINEAGRAGNVELANCDDAIAFDRNIADRTF